jgi:predicted GIY-YIG superfamily endonuclease
MNKNYIVYLLINTTHNKTYIGITNNQSRRIRQHNGEITGGARYTTSNKGEGEWKYYGWIQANDVLEKNLALSIEKKIKIRSKKLKGKPLERRIGAINTILEENPNIKFIVSQNESIINENQ